MFEAFSERDYRRFWTAQFISNIGSWMQAVAQGWLVYRLTDSAFLLGFVGFASSAPAVLLMLPGGVIADQLDRKKVVAASQIVQALTALSLAIAIRANAISVWHIITAAVVVGIAQSFSAPAFQAMVVDLLETRAHLPNAIAMNSLQFNTSRAIGPLIAGVTLSAWGSDWCFLINALSFLPLVWVLFRTHNRQQPLEGSAAMFERLSEGLRFVRADRVLLLFLALAAAASLFGYPSMTLMPVVARAMFADEAAGLGYLMGATGAGALAGALALSVRTPSARRAIPLIVGSLSIFGVSLGLVGMFRAPTMVLPLLFLCGVSMVVSMAMCNTSIQRRVPDALRGRVLSMYTFAFFAFIPFGNLAAGLVAERSGIRAALMMLGAGLMVSAVAGAAAARAGGRVGVAGSW